MDVTGPKPPLSDAKITTVFSERPRSSSAASMRPTPRSRLSIIAAYVGFACPSVEGFDLYRSTISGRA